jgi:voltage-gated potassium channel
MRNLNRQKLKGIRTVPFRFRRRKEKEESEQTLEGIEPLDEQKEQNREFQREESVPRVLACEESVKYKARRKRRLSLRSFWETVNSNNTLIIFLVVAGLLCVIAVGTYIFEIGVNDKIRSLWDTVWWTIVTLTTVGYGDKYPVTVGGKVLGIFMMVLGVASVGMVTGRIASFLVDKQIKARGGLIVLEKKKGHFIICGWKPELETVLEKILTIDPSLKPSDLVLVNDADPQEVDHIRSIPSFKTVKYIKGDYIDEKVLQRANVRDAKTVLILADSSKDFSLQEVDSRTVMTAITVDNMNKDVYTCAELVDEKFVKYLKLANCDEIILTREYSRELLANAASASGISHIAAELLNPMKKGLVTVDFQASFVGKPFKDLQEHYKSGNGDIVIGLLENTGNIYNRKKEALADAQKTPDISKLVENLQSVKRIFPNNPVLNPGDDYVIKTNSKAIIVTCNADTRQ